MAPPTIGPFAAFVPNIGRGAFDPVGRILYWVKSAVNVGNTWNACYSYPPGGPCTYPGPCYTLGAPECIPPETPNSWDIVVSALDVATLAVTDTTYGDFPFSWNAAPDGSLLLGGGNIYLGGASTTNGYRWHASPLGGPFAGPCPGVTSWGVLQSSYDDMWGGTAGLGLAIAYAYSPTQGLIHVGMDGTVWIFGATSGTSIGNGSGPGWEAVACAAGNDVWVLSAGTGVVLTMVSGVDGSLTNHVTGLSAGAGVSDIQYSPGDNTLLFWSGGTLYKWDIATSTMINSATVAWAGSGPVNGGLIPNGLDLYDARTLAKSLLTGNYSNPSLPGYSSDKPFLHFYDAADQYILLKANDNNVWGAGLEPYSGPPSPAAPVRYKRLPLKQDFASCSFDQANRLLMYELYRACGLDPLNPFLVALLSWLSGTKWQPPLTLKLTVWGESVDSAWNILKSGMAVSDTAPKAICGKVLTIDSVNYPEWNGDWEIVKAEYQPFGGQAAQTYGSQSGGEVTGSGELISAPAEGSGMLVLTLRTYNPNVFFDSSMTPSWTDVPGPWADGSY